MQQAMSCKWSKGTSGPAGDEHHNLIVAPLTTKSYADNKGQESKLVICFNTTQITNPDNGSNPKPGQPCHTLAAGNHPPAICLPINTQVGLRHKSLGERTGLGIGNDGDPAYTLQQGHSHGVMTPQMQVRRLTTRECERLQGFPDDYTNITFRGKPAADSPRYRALGNSKAVPVVRWLAERIVQFDKEHQPCPNC